jgi:hypothetical protein
MGDLHKPVVQMKQKLPDLRSMTEAAAEPERIDLAAAAEETSSKSGTKGKKKAVKSRGAQGAVSKKGRKL